VAADPVKDQVAGHEMHDEASATENKMAYGMWKK